MCVNSKDFIQEVGNSIYDAYVTTPYNLVIENTKKVFTPSENNSNIEKIATMGKVIGGCIYTSLLYGSTTFLAGKSLVATAGPKLAQVGASIQKVGENIFLSGAVPLYGLFYEFPKAIYHAVPKVLQATVDKVQYVGRVIFKYVLEPMYRIAISVTRTVALFLKDVIVKVSTIFAEALKAFANWCFTMIIKPLHTYLIVPIGQFIHKSVVFAGKTFKQFVQLVSHVAQFAFEKIILPLWNKVFSPIFGAICHGFQWMCTKIAQAAMFVMKKVQLVWKSVVLPCLKAVGTAFRWSMEKMASAVSAAMHQVANVACAIFKAVRAAYQITVSFLKRYLFMPIYNYILLPSYNAACYVAMFVMKKVQLVWKSVILPCLKAVGTAFRWSIEKMVSAVSAAMHQVANVAYAIFKAVRAGYQITVSILKRFLFMPIYNYLLLPAYKAVGFVAMLVGQVAAGIFNNVLMPIGQMIYATSAKAVHFAIQIKVAVGEGVIQSSQAIASVWRKVAAKWAFSF